VSADLELQLHTRRRKKLFYDSVSLERKTRFQAYIESLGATPEDACLKEREHFFS
jgi:hypothetical protein